jgi:hypothetical protein
MGMLGICPFLPIGFILLRSFISYFSYAFKWVIVPILLGFDMTTIVADPVSYPFPSAFLYTFFRCVSAAWSVLLAVGTVTVLTFKKEYFYDFAAAVGFLTALSQSTKVYDDNQASVFWLLVRGVPMWDFEPVKRAVGSVIDGLMTGTARSGGAGQDLVDWETEGLGMDWKQGLVTILVMVWAVKCESSPVQAVDRLLLLTMESHADSLVVISWSVHDYSHHPSQRRLSFRRSPHRPQGFPGLVYDSDRLDHGVLGTRHCAQHGAA